MKIEWLFEWYNLIFVVPFVLALLYVGIYAVSGLTFGDTDVDASADVDADAHVELEGHVEAPAHIETEANFDADHDADLSGDADTDIDTDVDADAHVEGHGADEIAPGSVLAGAMSLLGVGRVPLSIILM